MADGTRKALRLKQIASQNPSFALAAQRAQQQHSDIGLGTVYLRNPDNPDIMDQPVPPPPSTPSNNPRPTTQVQSSGLFLYIVTLGCSA